MAEEMTNDEIDNELRRRFADRKAIGARLAERTIQAVADAMGNEIDKPQVLVYVSFVVAHENPRFRLRTWKSDAKPIGSAIEMIARQDNPKTAVASVEVVFPVSRT